MRVVCTSKSGMRCQIIKCRSNGQLEKRVTSARAGKRSKFCKVKVPSGAATPLSPTTDTPGRPGPCSHSTGIHKPSLHLAYSGTLPYCTSGPLITIRAGPLPNWPSSFSMPCPVLPYALAPKSRLWLWSLHLLYHATIDPDDSHVC